MPGKVRRIVTGVNHAGRSRILSDMLLPAADVAPGAPVLVGLWTTDSSPASNEGTHDPVPDGVTDDADLQIVKDNFGLVCSQ